MQPRRPFPRRDQSPCLPPAAPWRQAFFLVTPPAIVADSGCDLPAPLLERYQIDQVALIARFGTDEIADTPATRAEFWDRYDISQRPQTSAPSVGAWLEAFAHALHRSDEVIAITVTGKHSSTYSSAILAAAEFGGRVQVLDSWSLSLGEGLIVLRAAGLAQSGADTAAILAELRQMRQRLRLWFLLDTLEAIQHGGRLAPVLTAFKHMSALLSLKPVLGLHDGAIQLDGVSRSLRRGLQDLVDRCRDHAPQVVAVGHARQHLLAAETASLVAAATGLPRDAILVAEVGPALGVHAGPGAIGLALLPA